MQSYYVKVADDGFLDADTVPSLEPAEGLTEITNVTDSISQQYFTRYWSKYRYIDNGMVQAPGNLPDLSIDALRDIVSQQETTIAEQDTQLSQLNTLVPQLQQMVVQSTQAQAQSAAGQDQLKTMMVQMSQTLAQIQATLPTTDK